MKKSIVLYAFIIALSFFSCSSVQLETPDDKHESRNITDYTEQSVIVESTVEIVHTTDTQGAYSKDIITDNEIQALLRNSFFIRKIETVDNSEFVYDENTYIDYFHEETNEEHRYYRVIKGEYIINNYYWQLLNKTFTQTSEKRIFYDQYNNVRLAVPGGYDENDNLFEYIYMRPIKRESNYILTPDNYKIISNGGGKAEIELYYHQKQGDELIPLTATVRFAYTDNTWYAQDTWQIEYEDYLM